MATPHATSERPGTIVARRWRLVEKLGEGGMGEVFSADPIDGGPRVALKILRRDYRADRDVRARFLEEGRLCMRLEHPNIVRVFDCAETEDGTAYIAMDLLQGVPLAAYMQDGARIPIVRAAGILQAVLAGLAAAHARGIVHRDLKPDNVFLTRDRAGAFVVKLLDFGIAKVMEAAGGMGGRTRTGMLLGTPAYMSPEQARSARNVDQRADLWSAGVLLYEMVTGRPAFPAPTEYARLAAVLSVDPEPAARVDAALSVLTAFFDKALKKNRDERFSSAAEMAQALALVTDGASTRSAPPPPPSGDAPAVEVPKNPGAVGGTLASPTAPHASATAPHASAEVAAPIVVVAPLPLMPLGASGRGFFFRPVAAWLVIVLVSCALGAGFLLGWSVARLT